MPVDHYENFPVASLLMPARLRPAIEAIYAFARSADDIADEGDATALERLQALAGYEKELDRIERGEIASSPMFRRLAAMIAVHKLALAPFRDLLSAFSQDVTTTRYGCFDELLDYCRRSADPVGRLMLQLYGAATPENVCDADRICSALQLINFWQDVAIDWRKKRIYLPQEDLDRFGVTEVHFKKARVDAAWRNLMRFEVDRARCMMLQGSGLALRLPGRIGWELRMVIQGGLRILERIEAADYDMFRRRPKLAMWDWIRMTWRAIRMKEQCIS